MVLVAELRFFGLCLLWWGCLVLFKGSTGCQMQYVGRSNVTTELQSDVLLPCIFEPTLLGSDKTADVAAVWSQRDITIDNLVEIKLQGREMFWSNNGRRIKTFPELSESGNFSILLHNVQQSDLGLYHCELFNGTNCMIAYQEVHLGLVAVSKNHIAVIAGTSGGVVLLLFTACVCYIWSKRKRETEEEHIYDDIMDMGRMKSTCRGCCKRDTEETIYENDIQIDKMRSTSRGCCQDPKQEHSIYVNCDVENRSTRKETVNLSVR